MARVSTCPAVYRPLYDVPSVESDRCAVCGARWPLNRHHLVWRSWGELYRDGKRVPKPTVTLCGSGNTSGCHGKVHRRMLHFRNDGCGGLEYLETEKPTDYLRALETDGWRPVEGGWHG